MPRHNSNDMNPWEHWTVPNLAYAAEQYEIYIQNANDVEPHWRELFERWGEPRPLASADSAQNAETAIHSQADQESVSFHHAACTVKLVQKIRTYGHLAARVNPLSENTMDLSKVITHHVNDDDLSHLPVELVWPYEPGEMRNALDAINKMKQIYTQTMSFEFSHVHNEEERHWLYEMVETNKTTLPMTTQSRLRLLKQLIEVESFEHFLHRTFLGQKRFSVEGLDMLIPMVNEAVYRAAQAGANHILIGMAHRGRLNMLAHVLGKPYESIFSEFHKSPNKVMMPSEGSIGINHGWTGDVKYHLGADRDIHAGEVHAHITLANNPSHLEFVDPVVEGYARAAQEDRTKSGLPKIDTSKALPILIHGDAAFIGEGVVAETLNLSRLAGFQTGGTIHIIANNQIGFTTGYTQARSTEYASDLAIGFEIPIVHVNADDPEMCLAAINLAHEYRQRFKKDFLIDLNGYRRFGHNETDDPSVTQPLIYAKIRNHPSVRVQYAEVLKNSGILTNETEKDIESEVEERLQTAYTKMKNEDVPLVKTLNQALKPASYESQSIRNNTAVPMQELSEINRALLSWPESFRPYTKLERMLKKRRDAFEINGEVDWALAEALAIATILRDGTPVRLTGQDTERGTFAHRHFVLHDQRTDECYTPLHHLEQAKASFALYNSPLSEVGVLGFEYGYNVFAPETLVLWEAQFGDFVNTAQVIIDQFIMAGEAKWNQKSSLVMLLPHGYEGQGPEHSSARLERFLLLAADHNCTVANLTSAAQYFHLLRLQAALTGTEKARPLILMTPKSLLRHPRAASPTVQFSEGRFQPVLESPLIESDRRPDEVKRLILCSGKFAIDLHEAMEKKLSEGHASLQHLHVLRIEQLHPFPEKQLRDKVKSFTGLESVVWAQEEPQNMGSWSFVEPYLRTIFNPIPIEYAGRIRQSSPAEGSPDAHKEEQLRIIEDTLKLTRGDL